MLDLVAQNEQERRLWMTGIEECRLRAQIKSTDAAEVFQLYPLSFDVFKCFTDHIRELSFLCFPVNEYFCLGSMLTSLSPEEVSSEPDKGQ